MKPLRDMIHIKRIITEETKSGIYTGDMAANAKPARVLSVNQKCREIKVGDKVVIDARFLHELDEDDEYLVLEKHVIGIYRE